MAQDYSPKYLYEEAATTTASAAVTAGQTLAVTGSGTMGPADADAVCTGVAAFDAAQGAQFTFFPRGKVHITAASGSVTAGVNAFTGANGTVSSSGDVANKIGVFLTSGAGGELVEWLEH